MATAAGQRSTGSDGPGRLLSLFLLLQLAQLPRTANSFPNHPADAGHITASAGQTIIFNCDVDFPEGQPVPYVVQWWKKVLNRD